MSSPVSTFLLQSTIAEKEKKAAQANLDKAKAMDQAAREVKKA
eukprot:CAMPEP_0118930766 /NCGR_PEP_ID=MMETSP1169-20130426/7345_1 /TAXON_ID=36882 /ORGANISM="Pyramimonas obovata, Strain CCMP722" /LENGTH=42 /DNA_ID= /DNA_START= /DNA_END= /DNA_ORIENTATION=